MFRRKAVRRSSSRNRFRSICAVGTLFVISVVLFYLMSEILGSQQKITNESNSRREIFNYSNPLTDYSVSYPLSSSIQTSVNHVAPNIKNVYAVQSSNNLQRKLPTEYIRAKAELLKHPMTSLNSTMLKSISLEDLVFMLHNHPICNQMPIIISMASVGSDLYWQLIENFIYTMVKFDLLKCSIMVCVTDIRCMKQCMESSFPCYDYQFGKYFPVKKKSCQQLFFFLQ